MGRPHNSQRLDIASRAIEAVATLCATHGADQLSMQQVAAVVGCSAPALYRYFRNKEALLLAAHDEGFRRLNAFKAEAAKAARGDSIERLRQGGLAYLRFAFENPELYALMFFERAPERRIAAGADDQAAKAMGALVEAVEACQADGYLPGVSAEGAAFTFWSTVHGAVGLALRRRLPMAEASTAAGTAAVELIVELVKSSRR